MSSPKTVLITGSSSGFGRLTAERFQSEGWNVVATMRSPQKEQALTQLENVLVTRLDVTDEASIAAAISAGIERFGGIDVVVNNAAYGGNGLFEQFSDAAVRAMYDTNVFGLMAVSRAVLPHMRERGSGTIVNVSSRASTLGSANEYVDYAASNGAVDTLTTGLAVELGPFGVRVNCVRPGPIHTDIHASGGEPNRIDRVKANIPMGRGGHVDEVANTIVWLMSDEASYVSGALIDVAGGR